MQCTSEPPFRRTARVPVVNDAQGTERRWENGAHANQSLRTRVRHLRIRHAGRGRQGQGAEGGGQAGHRLRRRRARLPHPRLHRRGRAAGLRRAALPQVHPGGGAARAAAGDRGQDGAGFRLPGRGRPGAGHQRRQAGRLPDVRHPARPGRRGHRAGPLLDHLSRGHRAGRRGDGAGPHRRAQWLPGLGRGPRGGQDRPQQGAPVRVAVQPDRGGLLPRAGQADRRVGRGARPVGGHRRDLRAPGLRRRDVLLDPGPGAGDGRTPAWC